MCNCVQSLNFDARRAEKKEGVRPLFFFFFFQKKGHKVMRRGMRSEEVTGSKYDDVKT